MRLNVPTAVVTFAIALGLVVTLAADVNFTSTFKSPDASTVSFAGKTVAAMVISNDESLRIAGEEALVRELKGRGMLAVATYRIAPKEELRTAETAKPWFERGKVEGVVAVRPVSKDTTTAYSPVIWTNSNYGSLWGYYGYGWSAVYIPGLQLRDTVVVVETTIYSVPRNELLWAAVTETSNPRTLSAFVQELAKASVEEMQKQGLARRQLR